MSIMLATYSTNKIIVLKRYVNERRKKNINRSTLATMNAVSYANVTLKSMSSGHRACKLFNIRLSATLCFNYFR